jgi:hypothetical protein
MEISRESATVNMLKASLNLTDAQVDDIFQRADAIEA